MIKCWYNIELAPDKADVLKEYLRKARIYFEPSEAGNLVHFECCMTEDECESVTDYLAHILK